MSSQASRQSIALLMPNFGGGGVQSTTLILARALSERGYPITLLLHSRSGPLVESVPKTIRQVVLARSSAVTARVQAILAAPSLVASLLRPVVLPWETPNSLRFLRDLAAYLRREKPHTLFASTPNLNIEAILARRLSGQNTRVVISERVPTQQWLDANDDWNRRYLRTLMNRLYGEADGIIAVSNGVANGLAGAIALPRDRITTIYNPVVLPDIAERAARPTEHPWFVPGSPPVILAVGRPGRVKDHMTLLRAFALVREQHDVRLVVIGENRFSRKPARRHTEFESLAVELKVAEHVTSIAHTFNPFAFFARAAMLVVSSRYEGFCNVVLEALACGCPVVSTDCPVGPSEILQGGRYGKLVPVGDPAAMARAICQTLNAPPEPDLLRERAGHFSFDDSIAHYEELLMGSVRHTVRETVRVAANGNAEAFSTIG
jgi:glycosyltransferase involved in cell wall biosynthesis